VNKPAVFIYDCCNGVNKVKWVEPAPGVPEQHRIRVYAAQEDEVCWHGSTPDNSSVLTYHLTERLMAPGLLSSCTFAEHLVHVHKLVADWKVEYSPTLAYKQTMKALVETNVPLVLGAAAPGV
jgi:hypothetical protein